jgi:hypothetical protein
MSTFEALSLVVGCLALAVSLLVWSGQRRLQREANELQRATSELAKKQAELLEKQELEPAFRLMWSTLSPVLTRLLVRIEEWLARSPVALVANSNEILPPIPEPALPDFESFDWRYAPRVPYAVAELLRTRDSLSTLAIEYNRLKIMGSERFWLVERLARIGFNKETESRYDYFGGEDHYRTYALDLLAKCGLKPDQPDTAIAQSPKYLQLLEGLREKVVRDIERLSLEQRSTLAQVTNLNIQLGVKAEA